MLLVVFSLSQLLGHVCKRRRKVSYLVITLYAYGISQVACSIFLGSSDDTPQRHIYQLCKEYQYYQRQYEKYEYQYVIYIYKMIRCLLE